GGAGAVLLTALPVWIGLLAFWMQDVSPVYWVCQKLLFVLGGMMLPLHLYPEVVQRLAAVTPLAVLLPPRGAFVCGVSAVPGGARRAGVFRVRRRPARAGRARGASRALVRRDCARHALDVHPRRKGPDDQRRKDHPREEQMCESDAWCGARGPRRAARPGGRGGGGGGGGRGGGGGGGAPPPPNDR